MVGKSENILTEFDYNNITIVDPNKVVDELGNIKERYVNQEDLVMYANLEAKMLPRTKLSVGVNLNDAVQTLPIASINFLKPGGKEFLDNTYTDELTGKDSLKGEGLNQTKQTSFKNPNKSNDFYIRQSVLSGGKAGSTDTGLLGITNISMTFDTSFLPVIRVELVDIKGRAMFESGNNSPYAAFFNLPYPKFYLTLKGFYGKALRLELMMYTFNTRYDTGSGNFNISLVFYTYKYSMLAEVRMGMLLATPHMFKSSVQTKSSSGGETPTVSVNPGFVEGGYEKIREVYSEYKSKGLISEDFPELTIIQLKDRIEYFVKNILDSFTKQNLDPLTDLDSYQKVLNEYVQKVFYLQGESWFETYMDKKQPFILKNPFKTKVYTFKGNFDQQAKADAIAKLKGLIQEYNGKLKSNETVGDGGTYTIDGKTKPSPIPFDITYEKTFLRTFQSADEIDFAETYRYISGTTSGSTGPTEAEIATLRADFERKNLFQSADVTFKDGNISITYQYFAFESNEKEVLNKVSNFLDPTFLGQIAEIEKKLKATRLQIEEELTAALQKLLQSSDNGIGFPPTMRNVLAIFFASGEAFLRLLDDTHREAWNQRNHPARKAAIFDSQTANANPDNINSGFDANTPVYPWPQFMIATTGEGGKEMFELKYPGDSDIILKTQGFDHEVWPEIEFEEEFIKGYVERLQPPQNQVTNFNQLNDVKRVSYNTIEFPINNGVLYNKEEIKFFFEIYERVFLTSNYSKLSRVSETTTETDKVVQAIADAESKNVLESLGSTNPFLIEKIKNYGFSSANYLQTLKHFSNEGTGQSWQNYLRGVFNTSYIKNLTNNAQFEFMDVATLLQPISSPLITLETEKNIVDFISAKTVSNVVDFTDIYPFTNPQFCAQGLAYGQTSGGVKGAFETSKTLSYNTTKKIITNFLDSTGQDNVRPVTNFIYKTSTVPQVGSENIKTFYQDRKPKKQLVTEGNINYSSYDGLVSSAQTTSMFNTPFFMNSIVEGVTKFRNNDLHPYTVPAYLFINSLPLATLREKYQTFETVNEGGVFSKPLDYIFATMKKFGAIHKVPYPWILKIGSIWYRYKKYIDDGTDILSTSWTNFNAISNYDPQGNDPTKMYSLILEGSPFDIVLQKDTVYGTETSTLINTGFYPGLINKFNLFYQGYEIINTEIEIKGTCDIQGNVMSVKSVNFNYLTNGYILDIDGVGSVTILSQQPGGVPGGEGTYLVNVTQNVSTSNFVVTNFFNTPYSTQSIQDTFDKGLNIQYSTESLIDFAEGFDDSNPQRDLRIITWSVLVDDNTGKNQYIFPSQGSTYNQVLDECFENGKIKVEVNNNDSLYNGSVRMFWAAPHYGYFDLEKLTKPSPEEYLKSIFINEEEQQNFSLNGSLPYTKISEIFSVFEKEILDKFEEEFLNFSKCKYDFVDNGQIKPLAMSEYYSQMASSTGDPSELINQQDNTQGTTQSTNLEASLTSTFKNFQILFTSLMKIPKITGETGDQIITQIQNKQTSTIASTLDKFINYDVAFKFGNPSSYNKKLFNSFLPSPILDGFTWESYKDTTPNALPTGGNLVSLSTSKSNYPDAWKALEKYVGFSDISSLVYSDSGSYITDFFVDLDVAFNENNIINLYPIIKIYATQKLTQFQKNVIPPTLPTTQNSNNTILETVFLSGGSKIIIYGPSGPRKFAVLNDPTGDVVYTGQKISKGVSNTNLINEVLFEVFVSQGIEEPPIVNRVVEPVPQYPLIPNPTGKWSKFTLSNSLDVYNRQIEDFQNKILDAVFIKLRNSYSNFSIVPESIKQSVIEGPQSKIELWGTFKALNDKWIAGNDFKQKTLFEDVLLLDRASRNIGDVILCDIYKLKNRLNMINVDMDMQGFVNSFLVENNFHVMSIPGYINFYNVQDAQKNAKPKLDNTSEFANTLFGTYLNVDYRESSTKMVCFYTNQPSMHVDVKDNVDYVFRDDSFELTKASNNPLAENQVEKKDWDKSNKCVGFSVDIGPQNQSIFHGFNVSQGNGQSTEESLKVINDMANQAGNRSVGVQNVSLYNLYKNRSYSCTVSMMGNAMMMPTMYFNLRYVPMFHGPYMILKVTHSITPGNFETIVEGIRQPTASLPKVGEFLQILKTNLVNSIIEESKRQKEAQNTTTTTSTDVKTEQNQVTNSTTTNQPNTASANQTCTANTAYSTFTLEQPVKQSLTANELSSLVSAASVEVSIPSVSDQQKKNLRLVVFSSVYLESAIEPEGFGANNFNFIGLKLNQDWGQNYMKPSYFCSSDNTPYASFSSAKDSIKFLTERFAGRMVKLENPVDEKSITKFWIENFSANNSGTQQLYSSFNLDQLNSIQSKVQKALNLFNSLNPSIKPFKDKYKYGVANPPIFEELTVTIDPTVDGPRKITWAKYTLQSTADCADETSDGFSFAVEFDNNYISSDGQTFTVDNFSLFGEAGCQGDPTSTTRGEYDFRVWLSSQPVLENGSPDPSRGQIISKSYPITFTI